MESWQHSRFEEKVDLDTIVLSPSDVYSNEGVQELNSGIKEEQFEDDTDIIDNSAHNDVKTDKVKLMEEKSDINCYEFPRIHEMESESFNPDALEIETKDDLIDEPKNLQSSLIPSEDSIKKSTFINNVHKQLVQQCFLTKQTKLHCKCKVCGVQSTDLNWFAKHVAEHKQDTKRSENLPSVEESVLKLQKSGLKIQKFEEKSVLKVEPKIVQSTSTANEPIVNVPKSKPEPIIVNDLKEIIDTQKQEPIRTEKIPNIVLNELHDTSSLGNLSSLWQDIPSLIVNEPNPIVNELEEVSIIDSKNAESNQNERELKIILKNLQDTTSAKNLCSLWQDMPEPIVNELKEVLIVDFQKQEPITTPSSLDTGQKI